MEPENQPFLMRLDTHIHIKIHMQTYICIYTHMCT